MKTTEQNGSTENGRNGWDSSRTELRKLHERLLERLDKMTPEGGFQTLVASGIYTPDGKLTKEYGG